MDYHVADCISYNQGMKSLGYAPDKDDMIQMDENEFYKGLITLASDASSVTKEATSGWVVLYSGRP